MTTEGKRYDILLAHPDAALRTDFENQVTQNNFARVVSLGSAREAVNVLSRTPVDALACPIELGEIDVWRLARMVRSRNYGCANLPIIALCDANQAPVVEALAKSHDIHLLSLSDDVPKLGERIAEIIHGRVKYRVLIIEDDQAAAHAAQRALEKAYDVEVRHHGREGLKAWLERRHDIVLLDVMLPGLSGPEILPQILAENPRQLVIVLTAYSTRERHEDLVFAGASEFLPKPFDITQLASLCDRLLHSHRLVETLQATQHSEAVNVRLTYGMRAAGYKLSQGLPDEASQHLQHALAGIDTVMSDDDWAHLLSETR